ncbi:hypothetical protein D3C81_1217380 [compost metagenome]
MKAKTKAEVYGELIAKGGLEVEKVEDKETHKRTVYKTSEGVSLEYIVGNDGKWELLKSKKNGGWHGEYFKVDGVRIIDAKIGDKEMKEPSKSKSFVAEYLKSKHNIEVKL